MNTHVDGVDGMKRMDRTSKAYKKELYFCTSIVVVLTLLGGSILGYRISSMEQHQSKMIKEQHKADTLPEEWMLQVDSLKKPAKPPVVR